MAKLTQNKLLLLFLLFNLCTYCGNAQFTSSSDDDRTFFGGLEAGGNFSQVDGDNFAGYHKAGWNVGVIVYTKLEDQFAASMELLLAQKGSRASQQQLPRVANDQNTILTDYTIKLNYLEVPILLNYFDKRKSNFGAGFSYAQLVGSREIYKNGQGAIFETEAKLYPFRKFDASFILNGNAHLWKGFFLNLRFQYSLIPIRKNYNPITGMRPQFSNVWTTRMVYLF
jgi:hypothetical protein